MAFGHADKQRLGRRYAAALFELAEEAKSLVQVEQDLTDLQSMLHDSGALSAALASPILKKNELSNAIEALLTQAKATELTEKFCKLLANNRRLALLPEIITAFKAKTAEARGEITANVTSARPLASDEISKISASLKKLTKKDIQVNETIDPSILGGLVIKVGSRMLDTSVSGRLDQLRLHLKHSDTTA